MAKYIDLKNATNEDLVAYLLDYWHIESFVFEGDFKLSKSKISSVSGGFSNIKSAVSKRSISFYPPMIKGSQDVVFFVPKNISLTQGRYVFECDLASDILRTEKNNPFLLRLKLNSIKPLSENNNEVKDSNNVSKSYSKDEILVKKNLKLKDDYFVGKFHKNPDGQYAISDIRRTDFSKLILQDGEQIQNFLFKPIELNIPEDNTYYEFSWILKNVDHELHKYNFTIDQKKSITKVTPKNVIDRLHKAIIDSPAGSGDRDVKMIETLKSQLTASGKEIFIYELLQNANDYPQKEGKQIVPVDVEFHIMNEHLVFMHSGAEFNERNIAAICNINDKEKSDNPNAIGYKGIGFKTVFVVSNNVYLSTGAYHFRFDESFTKDMVATAFQLLPIWTNPNLLGREVSELFKSTKERYNVQFALKPITDDILRKSQQNFVKLFSEVFENERVILFIPNINSVKVFFHDNNLSDIVRKKDSDNWVVNSYVESISEELRNSINDEIEEQEKNGTMKIPTKYRDFMKTQVSFACAREGAVLKKVENSILYCYLPAKDASWGLDFLLNTDMVPTGPRNDIEYDLEINKEIANIAGKKFFDWILGLCKSNLYKVDSIFALIPDFESCKTGRSTGHQNLITKFQEGFEERLLNEEFIPIGGGIFKKISDIILDETTLSCTGTIQDSDFLKIVSEGKYLPMKLLRTNKAFNIFLKRYLVKFGFSANIWNKLNLQQAITSEGMVSWLKNQENNNAFLKFLLEKKWLADFSNSAIYFCADGNLYSSSTIYNDKNIFDKVNYLKCFEPLIPHLTTQTVEYFKDNSEWDEQAKGLFTPLKSKSFVTGVLLNAANKENTINALKVKSNSILFYSFLEKYVNLTKDDEQKSKDESTIKILKELPFFGYTHTTEDNDIDTVIDSFNRLILTRSDEAISFVNRSWVENDWITFVSKDYPEGVVKYFKDYFDVRIYSDSLVACKFIRPYIRTENKGTWNEKIIKVNSPYFEQIVSNIQSQESNLDFFSFCFSCKDSFEEKDLYNYPLLVKDRDNEECYISRTEQRRYFDVPEFSIYSHKEWIEKGWMYKLGNEYLEIVDCNDEELSKSIHSFYHDVCGVVYLTPHNFCYLISSLHFKEIIKVTTIPTFDESQKENAEYVDEYNQLREKALSANVDFIRFIDANLTHFLDKDTQSLPSIFRDIVINDGFKNIPLDQNTYFPNNDLQSIIAMSWFPPTLAVNIVNDKYGESALLTNLGVKSYEFSHFYNDVIIINSIKICGYIQDFEKNKDFHKFMTGRVSSIAPDALSLLSQFPVYTIGAESQVTETNITQNTYPIALALSMSNHTILSSTVTQLFEKNLVKASELNIIHPDYKPDDDFEEYWSKFGNVRFEPSHFVEWLFKHREEFSKTISNTNENIEFWRWAKTNIAAHEKLGELNFLPIIVLPLPSESCEKNTDSSAKDTFKTLANTIYASNGYMVNEDIESFVKLYDENALFISNKYLTLQDDTESVAKWMDFWTKVGVKNDYLSIIINTIIPNLSTIENDNLPNLFVNYQLKLRDIYPDLPSILTPMLVKTADGKYRNLSSSVYINTNLPEPFSYITIPNSISFVGKEQNVSTLMLQVATAAKSTIVNTTLDWRIAKLKRYAELQTIKENVTNSLINANVVVTEEEKSLAQSFESIHLELLKDLAAIKANKNDSITDLETSIKSLKLYSSTDVLSSPKALTASSVYNPLCDYQSCGIIEEITYISDKYADIENINSLFNGTLGVRSGFSEKEIPLLETYPKFALYFWTTFLAKNIAGFANAQKTIMEYFRGGKFSNVACIPTEKSVKKPGDLYYGKEVDDYLDKLPNYKEKTPSVADIVFEENAQKVSLFSLLPFKSDKLCLQDCFDALLCYNDQKRRPKLLSWIVSQFNDKISGHLNIRDSYKQNSDALWFNGENEPKHISTLYALDEPNGKLSFYFGSHHKVFNTNYFPKGEDYLKACACLGIRVIHDNNVDMETIHVKSNVPDMPEDSLKKYLQMAVLILAGIESAPDWEPSYNKYSQEISQMHFICCESIILRFKNDNSISTDSKRFYHQSGTNTFLYVDSYKDPRLFTDFVGELISYLGIKADKDIVLNLLYDKKSALMEIEKRNQLKSDDRFMQFMDVYENGISNRYKGKKADETPTDVKIDRKTVEVKETKEVESEENIKQEEAQNSDTPNKENQNTNDGAQKETTPKEDDPTKEQQNNKDSKSSNPSNNSSKSQAKPSYERLDPNKYKRREMKVGTQNPKTMGINRNISDEEKRQLSEILGRAMEVDTIMNENYIVRLRFYNEVVNKYGGAKMDIQEFVKNNHGELESISNKFIHRCSARGGTLYISPNIWRLLAQDDCIVCMYYGKYADEFIFIESQEELMQMIDQDAIVIQVTGNEKKDIVSKVYDEDTLSTLTDNGNIYTLIRTIKEDNSQLVYTSPDDIPVNSYSDDDVDPDMF